MDGAPAILDSLAQLALFADLSRPQLEALAHTFEEEVFQDGQRVLRQGLSGSAFYLVVEGEASVRMGGKEQARLSRGDFFGEISVLTGESPSADVVATSMLRCLMIPGPEFESFVVERPRVAFRMLQAQARRLRSATEWQA